VSDYEAAATTEEREALGFKVWPPSGEQLYRVQHTGGSVDVVASTGDEAAIKALGEIGGGGKVTNIAPAPQRRTLKAKSE
jgi:hypothetical protein